MLEFECKYNSSNRTFMELKFETTLLNSTFISVLIVPLWN